MSIDETKYGNWREEELSLKEVIRKYPNISKFIIIKTDLQRRGVIYTEAAMKLFDPEKYSVANIDNMTMNISNVRKNQFILRFI